MEPTAQASSATYGMKNGAAQEPRDIEAFGREVDELLQKYRSKVGEEDIAFVERCFDINIKAEVAGRLLLHFSLDPFTWLLGSTLLAYHIGQRGGLMHAIHHGMYDGIPGIPSRFTSDKTTYNCPISGQLWQRFHAKHHAHTNNLHKDTDVGYEVLRWSDEVPWQPFHLIQLPAMLLTSLFPFGGLMFWYPFYQSGLLEYAFPKRFRTSAPFHEKHDWETFKKIFGWAMEGFLPYMAKNLLLYPALGGIFWPKVLLGNVVAHYLASAAIWHHVLTPHMGQPVYGRKPRSKAEWYVQQIEATSNLKVENELLKIFCAGNHQQIEHHVAPKLPMSRLWEMAPELEAICKKYGVRYSSEGWRERTKRVVSLLLRYSLPGG
ncbi:fatty acid desaturase [Sorangium sp. So ce296]|uniref:fatty acid desaturase family protein n=1 Tax=Sorangium sp. So ce296 TaxID=3133296 RepID=UPI003F646822